MDKLSTLERLGLPPAVGVLFLSISLALWAAAFVKEAIDFGLIRVPEFSPVARRRLHWIGPLLLLASSLLFAQIWSPARDVDRTPEPDGELYDVAVFSSPSGANVYVNDVFLGKTDCGIGLSPGSHEIVVQKDGYKPYRDRIRIPQQEVLTVQLERQ